MDYIRRILEFLANSAHEQGMVTFEHEGIDSEKKIIAVHPTKDGMIVLTVMTPEEYSMVMDIVELSGKALEDVLREFDESQVFATIEFDPKDFQS